MNPCGTFSVNYEQEMAVIRTKLQWSLFVGLLLLLLIAPLFMSEYVASVFNFMGIIIVLALGLQIALGYCGLIHIGQAAFVGVGAYSFAILYAKLGLWPWLAIPCSAFIAVLVGLPFSLISWKVKGFYLALVTLASQYIILWTIVHMSEWTGGIYTFLLPPVTCGELAFTSEREVWYIIMPVAGLMTFFAKSIVRGKLGRAFVAIRDNDIAANAMGINVFTYKVSAFAICSFYAGVAGSLWAIRNLAIHVDNFTLENSIWYLGIIIVGGIGSIFGVIIGTVFLQWLKEGMAILAPVVYEFWPTIGGQFYAAAVSIFFALVLIVFLIYEPRGLAHRWEILKRTYRLWPFRY